MIPTSSNRSFLAGTKSLINRFSADESGATVVEYGLLVALISAAIMGTLLAISGEIKSDFTFIADTFQGIE